MYGCYPLALSNSFLAIYSSNEEAVWSPDCPSETTASTPAGSSSSANTFDINDFIDYDSFDTKSSEPTKEPSSSEVGKGTTFIKPSGGKKPPPNKKPGSNSSGTNGKGDTNNGKGETVNVESTIDTPSPTPYPTDMPVTEAPTPIPVLSPDDPAATYFCGNDWIDANEVSYVLFSMLIR